MVKSLPAAQDTGSFPGSGRSPREGKGYPLQYSCLENPIDRPVFLPRESHGQRSLEGYSPWGCKESDRTERLTRTYSELNWMNGWMDG